MKNELTITFSVDNEWMDESTGDLHIDDENQLLAFVMDIMRSAIKEYSDAFEKAEFNGKLLFSKDGEAPEVVKQLPQYVWALKLL